MNMPTFSERNEKINVFYSPGFKMLLGYESKKRAGEQPYTKLRVLT